MNECDVAIVGAGLAGLCCARTLTNAGIQCQIFEASDDIGGRARTDEVDGFLLDRGFQVFLTSYPEARQVLDYDSLHLKSFEPGAKIRYNGGWHRIVDPWRRPKHLISTLRSPVGGLVDKIRVGRIRKNVCRDSLEAVMQRPERTTIQRLQKAGLSDAILDRFMKPFLGGVFLERELQTSSRMFDFVFRMFATGDATLPEKGMGQIAKQLASRLADDTIHLNCPVASLTATSVELQDGRSIDAKHVVLAVDAAASARLLGQQTPPASRSVSCLYFSADKPPISEPILVLNGDGDGPINNVCVPSQVSDAYAPAGQSLISVTVLEDQRTDGLPLEQRVREQLKDWFGEDVEAWKTLRRYDIDHALPDQTPPHLADVIKPVRHESGILMCGDYLDTASIQGAMASGRRAAEAILAVQS